ncbi:MAG: DNA mismatch repair endonuclease MutL, partial [Muribaculaceae bacterium]|nr:DNA mismatch repair endonuclease MutL [Muribaculaceae bacterium]
MNDVIKLLPDSVANQIAAGEVIQRPASVIKELVENAVDAGATQIKIVIKDGGRTLLQVIDNGCGMSATDARLAFERHSTSKITEAADLFALTTMGFRGEALASIAAVSQVELRTMRHDDSIGTRLCISASKVESQEPQALVAGSNMMVKNLFFNVPARRKFLKKDAVELSHILHEFERLALVNPGRELSITHNESLLHQLLPGSLRQRVGQLFGKSVERGLIPVETETTLVKINGFVGLPESARKRNWLQYFFVNGRNMKHPYFHKAIMQCYEKLIGPDVQRNYFINLAVDPSTIDVNIHPTKNEIKFENEQAIWQILNAVVRESLGRFNVAPAIDFSEEEVPDIPAFVPQPVQTAPTAMPDFIESGSSYNPFETGKTPVQSPSGGMRSSALNWKRESKDALSDWDKLYSQWNNTPSNNFSTSVDDSSANIFQQEEADTDADHSSVLQFKNKYILSPVRSGLMIIDVYRAHVRILYERYLAELNSSEHASQSLIFPEQLTLSASSSVIFEDLLPSLRNLGFEIEKVSQGNWAVNAVPAIVGQHNPVEMINGIIEAVTDKVSDIKDDIYSG